MNDIGTFYVILGTLGILYGFVSIYWRLTDPTKFSKLQPMKEMMGDKVGGAVHFVAYTVMPFIVGPLFILRGLGRL